MQLEENLPRMDPDKHNHNRRGWKMEDGKTTIQVAVEQRMVLAAEQLRESGQENERQGINSFPCQNRTHSADCSISSKESEILAFIAMRKRCL
jgi:hypothetical protein